MYKRQLWHYVIAGNRILLGERVQETPYLFWSPVELSHKLIGLCPADLAVENQKARTGLMRGVIDNVYLTNTTRLMGDLTKIRDPRSIIDNHIGSFIDVAPGAEVVPVPQAQLNPATYQALEMLAQDKEQRTGSARIAQGLNQDAVSKQNADDLIERLTSAANERIMVMARSFAEQVMAPLFEDLLMLGAEYEYALLVEVEGEAQQAHPGQLGHIGRATVARALTHEEAAQQANTLMSLHQMQAMDPVLANLYGIQQRRNVVAKIYELTGIDNIERYLADPADPQVQQSLQQSGMQQEQEKQVQLQLVAAGEQRAEREQSRKEADTASQIADREADNIREDTKLVVETALESEQERAVDI